MTTTQDFNPDFNLPNFIPSLQSLYKEAYKQGTKQSNPEAFKIGQKDILEKLMVIAKPWIQGKDTNEDFAKKLNELFNDYEPKRNKI